MAATDRSWYPHLDPFTGDPLDSKSPAVKMAPAELEAIMQNHSYRRPQTTLSTVEQMRRNQNGTALFIVLVCVMAGLALGALLFG